MFLPGHSSGMKGDWIKKKRSQKDKAKELSTKSSNDEWMDSFNGEYGHRWSSVQRSGAGSAHLLLLRPEYNTLTLSAADERNDLILSLSLYRVPHICCSISLLHKDLRSWINQRQGEACPLEVHAEAALMVVVTSTRTFCLTESLHFSIIWWSDWSASRSSESVSQLLQLCLSAVIIQISLLCVTLFYSHIVFNITMGIQVIKLGAATLGSVRTLATQLVPVWRCWLIRVSSVRNSCQCCSLWRSRLQCSSCCSKGQYRIQGDPIKALLVSAIESGGKEKYF